MSGNAKEESAETLPGLLVKWSKVKPESPAFIFYDPEWNRTIISHREVLELSSKYAAILRQKGIKKGDVVCNTLPNSPERLITQYGCTLAGAISINGQVFMASGANFLVCLRKSKCRALIVNPNDANSPLKLLENQLGKDWTKELPHDKLPEFLHVLEGRFESQGDEKSLMDVLQESNATYICDSEPTDTVHVFTTSGTTGFSKMIGRSHGELIKLCNAARQALDIKEGDVYFNDRPLGWTGGYPMTYPVGGNTRVLIDLSKGPPKEIFKFTWDLICKEKCDLSFIVPYHIEKLSQVYDTQGSSGWKLRNILSGGQPLKKIHLDAVGKITKALSVTYGSTEAGTISFKRITDGTHYTDCNNGPLATGVEVKIIDKNFQEVPQGSQGEILIRSNQLIKSYFNGTELENTCFLADGWYKSGDIGNMSSIGEISVVCREKFQIFHGSYIIYPGWVEVLLLKCPDVQSVTAVPVPDPVFHQEVCACVIRKTNSDINEETLDEFFRSFFLKDDSERTPCPKYYLFFSNFPTTSTGKIDRNALLKIATQRLELSESN